MSQTQSDAERVTQLLLLLLREGHITPAASLPAGRKKTAAHLLNAETQKTTLCYETNWSFDRTGQLVLGF